MKKLLSVVGLTGAVLAQTKTRVLRGKGDQGLVEMQAWGMSNGPASRCVILVVDDEPVVLSLLCDILTRQGYVVLGAASGEQALEAYQACGPFDLVVADVVMPRMNGPELADRLWEIDPALRVLFVAALPNTPTIRTAILDRGLPLLPKPFLPHDLVARVEEVLHAPDPRSAPRG